MLKKNIKIALLSLLTTIVPFILFGQEVETAAKPSISLDDKSLILVLIIIALLIPVFITGRMFLKAAKFYMMKLQNKANKIVSTLVIMVISAQITFAQSAISQTNSKGIDWSVWGLFSCIILEILIILYFSFQTSKFLKDSLYNEEVKTLSTNKSWMDNLWDRMNRFKPIAEEGQIDTGHDYDGIRELDNITPPWFTAGFILTILFAIVYMYRYHIAKTSPLPMEEFKIEMAEAKLAKSKYLSMQADQVDENTVKMLDDAGIASGKKIFEEKCVACHESHGGSKAGGVGPNLTDDYWIHGGSLKSIFTTIKYGWPDKGMISWSDQMSSSQIAEVSSFVKSLKGNNPAGAKEKQGELYVEEMEAALVGALDTAATKK